MSDAGAGLGVRIGLSAVIMAVRSRTLCVLTVGDEAGELALPFGPFDPERDRTFELALRTFVADQTGFRPGFVEQLYTFGDAGRTSPQATRGPARLREISVGYLALTRDQDEPATGSARWTPVFSAFPWEDRRTERPSELAADLLSWARGDEARLARIAALFAVAEGDRWNEERVLQRYELLYEAGLVDEAARDRPGVAAQTDRPNGRSMTSDHRRILATGLGRLRSKLKYRPVLFDLAPDAFTLSQLQTAAEAVTGLTLHKQNFRRGVERTGLVEATGRMSSATGGRPAELYRYRSRDIDTGQAPGLALPARR